MIQTNMEMTNSINHSTIIIYKMF